MKTKRVRKIQESDIDALNHVNYAVYIDLMTEGRMEWIGGLVDSLAEKEKKGDLACPIVHIDMSYVKETMLGDELTVVTEPNEIGNKSFSLKQKIYNQQDELVAKAVFTHVMFELENRTSIPVVPEIRKAFETVEVK